MNRLWSALPLVLSVIALIVALVRGPSAEDAESEPGLGAAGELSLSEGDLRDLENRVSALEMNASSLLKRIMVLERETSARPVDAAGGVTPEQRNEIAALRADVEALMAGAITTTERGREQLKDVVRAIQDEVFAERARARDAERERSRTERVRQFALQARLTATQESDILRLLEDEERQRRELFQGAAGGGGPGRQSFSQLRALRNQTDEAARRILSPDQLEQFQQMRREERGGRGGRLRGGPANRSAP